MRVLWNRCYALGSTATQSGFVAYFRGHDERTGPQYDVTTQAFDHGRWNAAREPPGALRGRSRTAMNDGMATGWLG